MMTSLVLMTMFTLAAQPAAAAPQQAPSVPTQPTPPAAPASKDATPKDPPANPGALQPFTVSVPGSGYKLKFAPIPADPARGIGAFWMCTTELPWDAFDVYVFKLDEPEESRSNIDAKTHPSKPYLPPDRGFGHANFAAISLTAKAAEGFCAWLSGKTGMHFRLATEDEWEHAALAGANPPGPYGFEGGAEKLADHAWFKDNSGGQPHAIAGKKPNAWGLYDMHGNVAEWVRGREGKPVVKGGSYNDPAENLAASWRSEQQRAWNMSDPQVPKSRWWLSDGPFVGFRVVRDLKARPASP